MAVTVDATAAAATVSNGATSLTSTNLTVTSAATALLVWTEFDQAVTNVAANWDNTGTPQAMTQIAAVTNSTAVCQLWGLLNPTPGAKTLSVTWTTSAVAVIDSISFAGTSTSSIADCFRHAVTSTGNSGTGSLVATGSNNSSNIMVAGVASDGAGITSITTTGSTTVFTDATNFAAGGARAPSATSLTWASVQGTGVWSMAGCEVCAPGGYTTAQVGIDAVATAVATTASATTLSNNNLTISTAATSLLAFVQFSGSPTAITCTWDAGGGSPQTMTLIQTSAGTGVSTLAYGLVRPHPGNLTLTVSWTTASACKISAMSFTNTISHLTIGTGGCFTNFNTASGLSASQSSSSSNSVIGNMSVGSGVGATSVTSLVATGSTTIFRDNTTFGGAAGYAPITSTANVPWTLTLSSSQQNAEMSGQIRQEFRPSYPPLRQRPGRRFLPPRRDYTTAAVVPTTPEISGDSITIVQELPSHPSSRFWLGVQGPNVAAPPQIGGVLVRQELPGHPLSVLGSGVQGPNVRPPIVDTVLVRQQQPDHPPSLLQHRIFGLNVRPPVTDSIAVYQEVPRHAPSVLLAGVQGPNVRVPTTDVLLVRQQQPDQPPPTLRAGVQGPNVRVPVSDSITIVQELPSHPSSRFWLGVQGPNVRAPVSDTLLVRQEVPSQPLPLLLPGPPPPPVTVGVPPTTSNVVVVQEAPRHAPSVLLAGPQGPDVRVPVTDRILVLPQPPDQPPGRFLPGVQGPNVRVPTTDVLLVRQQQPDHPGPALRAGVQGPNVRVPVSDSVVVRQEVPGHPGPVVLAGPQGPNVASGIGSVVVRQEQPGHPSSILAPGPYPSATVSPTPPTTSNIVVVQQQPGHPGPVVLAGVQGPNVAAPPQIGEVLMRQEVPGHPASTLRAGVQGPSVRPPIVDTILGRQEQPGQPPSALLPGVPPVAPLPQPPMVATRQEVPGHPPSTLLPGLSPAVQAMLAGRHIVVRQEVPSHPSSTLVPGVYTQPVVQPVPPITNYSIGRLEWPWHPPGWVRANFHYDVTPPPPPPPPPVFVQGRTVMLLSDQLQYPSQDPARTVVLLPDIVVVDRPAARTVLLLPDSEVFMQLPSLLQYGPTGPMDHDPFTVDASRWLATVSGDTLLTAVATVYGLDGSAQTDVTVDAQTIDASRTMATAWLTGGVPGTVYRVTWALVTTPSGRRDRKSVGLPVVQARS